MGHQLIERRQSVNYRESLAIGSNLQSTLIATVPRGAIGRLRRCQISISLIAALTATTDAIMMLVKETSENFGDPTNADIEQLQPLWMTKLISIFEAGATDTANVVSTGSKVETQLLFTGDAHRGEEIRNQGPRSNALLGWSMMGYSTIGGTNVWQFVSLEWDMIWIENTGPSPSIGWLNDEEQNQDV